MSDIKVVQRVGGIPFCARNGKEIDEHKRFKREDKRVNTFICRR
jgi:hypothetical protein